MKFYQNKVVWIIGGTSGIGLSISKSLSDVSNCTVIISGRDVSKLGDTLGLNAVELDVNNKTNFDSAFDFILSKYSKIDIILFCAGAYEPMNIDTFNSELATKILQTNLSSTINFVANISKLYNKCKMIGIVSSVAGYFGMPNSLFYGASKAGLSHLAQSLYMELKKHKIDVKLINPGFVKTRLTEKNKFKMPFIISSETAARIILQKLQKNNFEIAFPYSFVFLLKIFQKIPIKLRSIFFKSFS
jgi:short-subunit dehydrogenase